MLVLFKFLHIGLAAAWFGHKLLVPSDLRASVNGAGSGSALLRRIESAERLGQLTGIGTLVSGLALLFIVGAATVDIGVWVGLGLVLLAILIGATVARPASIRLKRSINSGSDEDARSAATRINRVLAVESLLWCGALLAMLI